MASAQEDSKSNSPFELPPKVLLAVDDKPRENPPPLIPNYPINSTSVNKIKSKWDVGNKPNGIHVISKQHPPLQYVETALIKKIIYSNSNPLHILSFQQEITNIIKLNQKYVELVAFIDSWCDNGEEIIVVFDIDFTKWTALSSLFQTKQELNEDEIQKIALQLLTLLAVCKSLRIVKYTQAIHSIIDRAKYSINYLDEIGSLECAKRIFPNSEANKTEILYHHICYDSFLFDHLSNDLFNNLLWKQSRNAAYNKAERVIANHFKNNNKDKHLLIFVDDNMHFRSMRYKYFKLAKLCSSAFLIIHFMTNCKECIRRNALRSNIESSIKTLHPYNILWNESEERIKLTGLGYNMFDDDHLNYSLDSASNIFQFVPHEHRVEDNNEYTSIDQQFHQKIQGSESGNLWSVGTILYAVLTGYPPFWNEKAKDGIIENIKNAKYNDRVFEGYINLKQFVCRLLQRDPTRRGTALSLLSMPWFSAADCNNQIIENCKGFDFIETDAIIKMAARAISNYVSERKKYMLASTNIKGRRIGFMDKSTLRLKAVFILTECIEIDSKMELNENKNYLHGLGIKSIDDIAPTLLRNSIYLWHFSLFALINKECIISPKNARHFVPNQCYSSDRKQAIINIKKELFVYGKLISKNWRIQNIDLTTSEFCVYENCHVLPLVVRRRKPCNHPVFMHDFVTNTTLAQRICKVNGKEIGLNETVRIDHDDMVELRQGDVRKFKLIQTKAWFKEITKLPAMIPINGIVLNPMRSKHGRGRIKYKWKAINSSQNEIEEKTVEYEYHQKANWQRSIFLTEGDRVRLFFRSIDDSETSLAYVALLDPVFKQRCYGQCFYYHPTKEYYLRNEYGSEVIKLWNNHIVDKEVQSYNLENELIVFDFTERPNYNNSNKIATRCRWVRLEDQVWKRGKIESVPQTIFDFGFIKYENEKIRYSKSSMSVEYREYVKIGDEVQFHIEHVVTNTILE